MHTNTCRRIQLKREFSVAKAKAAGDEEAAEEADDEKAEKVRQPAGSDLSRANV